jgi:hypothetical protein
MKTTSDEEIILVKKRITNLGDGFNAALKQKLLTKAPRLQQHRLFWLLLDDKTYQPIIKSLGIIKQYKNGYYHQRALNKLADSGDSIQYKANIAEIIAVAYYMNKFMDDVNAVTWERRLSPSKNSVDITLNNYKKPINIEVTGLSDQKALSDFWSSRYYLKDVKDELQPLVLDNVNPRYGIIMSFGDFNLANGLPELDVKDFADFIRNCKAQGVGEYKYPIKDEGEAEVRILKLNKSPREYIEDMTVWSGWIRDSLRTISKVVLKADKQLPKGEFNFVDVCNLASMEDDDYYEAMLGQLQVTVNSASPKEHSEGYADNGISRLIHDNGYSEVHGIIKSGFDYFNNDETVKKVVANPRLKVPDEVYNLIA